MMISWDDNTFCIIGALWGESTSGWINIGSGNGLLSDSTKPLPEPMLTCHQWGSMTTTWGQVQEIPRPSMTRVSLKITDQNFHFIAQTNPHLTSGFRRRESRVCARRSRLNLLSSESLAVNLHTRYAGLRVLHHDRASSRQRYDGVKYVSVR